MYMVNMIIAFNVKQFITTVYITCRVSIPQSIS